MFVNFQKTIYQVMQLHVIMGAKYDYQFESEPRRVRRLLEDKRKHTKILVV